jgi:CubicO group peptidase (beta-lactamase class C family)
MRAPAILAHAALLCALAAPAAGQTSDPLAGMDEYVAAAVRQWRIPGLAMAIVKDDSVVYQRGFGVTRLGGGAPVDANTLFAGASTTKAFTTMALGMLVDEGRVRWDDPVAKHLPGFQLADPHTTRELTVRDLVTHRSGLASADELWYASDATTADIVRTLRFQAPASSLRSRYAYNNNAYAVAGEVIRASSGIPWDEFVRRRILAPLGMASTLTGLGGLEERPNHAKPHLEVDGAIRPIAHRSLESIGAAGSMNSSVADMARWLRFQLDSGRVGGRRLVSDSVIRETWAPQTIIPVASRYPAARLSRPNFTAYGLGWFLQDHRGRKVAMHTGSIDGMSALVALVPDERLGLVVFANLDHAELRHALMYRVIDAYTGAPPRDWSADLHRLYAALDEDARASERRRDSARVAGTRPSLALAAYAGSYADSLQGEVQVRAEGSRLAVRWGSGRAGPMEHWHFDTFRARWEDLALGTSLVTFVLDAAGRPRALVLEGVGEFRRVPGARPR